MRPARTRFRPWATKRRLLASSLTTSATVPSATRSSKRVQLGLWALRVEGTPRWRSSARVASKHVEHDAHAGDGTCSRNRNRAGWGSR